MSQDGPAIGTELAAVQAQRVTAHLADPDLLLPHAYKHNNTVVLITVLFLAV